VVLIARKKKKGEYILNEERKGVEEGRRVSMFLRGARIFGIKLEKKAPVFQHVSSK